MTCHLCEAPLSEAITVGTTARHGEQMHTVACARCGLVQATPLPSEAELAAYYAGPYRATFKRAPVHGHEWGTPEAEALMDEGARTYAAEIAAAIGLRPESRVLEVGCGDGRLASMLAEHCGVEAIEADVDMARESAARGVSVAVAPLALYAERASTRYDAIVSCHVLEHFRSPLEALAQMRSLLVPGGRLWLEVPNAERPYGDLDTHYWQRPHLYNFTPHTLALTLLRAGLDDVRIYEDGHVLYALATHGDREPVSYDAAAARHGRDVPTGAEVAAMLDGYRLRFAAAQRTERAVVTLQRFRDGEDVDAASLRDAVDLLGEQSVKAARIAEAALREGAALVRELDAQVLRDDYHPDPWVRGYRAGEAATAARVSYALGRAWNSWKLAEVEAKR